MRTRAHVRTCAQGQLSIDLQTTSKTTARSLLEALGNRLRKLVLNPCGQLNSTFLLRGLVSLTSVNMTDCQKLRNDDELAKLYGAPMHARAHAFTHSCMHAWMGDGWVGGLLSGWVSGWVSG